MCFPLFLSWGKVFDAKKRLVICRHILEREVEEDALKLAVVAPPRSDGRKEKKRESDGHSGGLWVVDETRPRSAFCVLLVLGKDILEEEGATSTTRISLQLESRFIIPNRFRSLLSLSRYLGGEYNRVAFARGKNATLTLKITSPFVRASSRSSR